MYTSHNTAVLRARLSVILAVLSLGIAAAWADGSVAAWGYNGYGQCDVPVPNDDFAALSAGYFHNLGLKLDGSIVAWGDNECGQCDVPAPNSGFIGVAAGGYHSLGLKADGSIVAWGTNTYQQCSVPAPNADFIAVAAGYQHSLGLKSDGRIIAWGDNALGQCNVPADNAGFIALAAGFYHSLGLKADGSIAAWGSNTYGQCTLPSPNTGFVALAAGEAHSLGLKTDGSLKAWGNNAQGQCTVPAPNSGFVGITAGQAHTLALRADGTVAAWGWNAYGQCSVPTPNAGGVAVAAGGYHSIALRLTTATPASPSSPNPSDGATSILIDNNLDWADALWANSYDVYFGATNPPPLVGSTLASHWTLPPLACWTTYYWQVDSRNSNGITPGPVWSFASEEVPPADVPTNPSPSDGGTNVPTDAVLTWSSAGAASYDVYFGLTDPPPLVGATNTPVWAPALESGLRWYWQIVAKNECGAAAGPVWTFTTVVVAPSIRAWGENSYGQCDVPPPNADFTAVDGGGSHSLGLNADGSIVAWGDNYYGECNVPAPNSGFMVVAAGGEHSLGLKADGSIVAWGYNNYGQCNVPVPIAGFVALAAGGNHSLGLKSDGSIVAWGYNYYDQCNVPGPNTGFVAIAAGGNHSLGLKLDGSIVAFGYNRWGQCTVPIPNSGFVAVAAGNDHSLGLRTDGSILAWGHNTLHECDVPAPNAGFVAVATGGNQSLGLKAQGSIVAWGRNDYGQCNVPAPNGGFVAISGGAWHTLGLKSGGALPAQFGSPSPSDGATNDLMENLDWPDVPWATSYDVYFGTSNPPPFVGVTLASRWMCPPLACGTTYYWQIAARNWNGTSLSPLWTFSTTSHAPQPPAGASPSDGAVSVAPDTVLGWDAAEGATSYELYFGPTNPPPLLATAPLCSWTPPALACETTYYWQVAPRNCCGATLGPVWSFSTPHVPDPPANLSPIDGALHVPTVMRLQWAVQDAASYDVYFGRTNPPPRVSTTTWNSWDPGILGNSTTYYWQIAPRNVCGPTLGSVWSFTTISLLRGDLNCDGVVTFADINPFVLALSGRSAYEAAYPSCNWYNADCNYDGVVSFADIRLFVNCLAHGGCP